MIDDYLGSCKKQFEYYKYLGDKTFESLKEEDIFHQSTLKSNSIAVIVQHMHGNMLSRWTNFLTSDGEKEWRNRDQEFELYLSSKDEMLEKWNSGWLCLFEALDSINTTNFNTTIYIRNQGHNIVEAINRQLCHYAYHVGQIVNIGRDRTEKWKSLSIPKGDSKTYNKTTFAEGKRKEHFSDKYIKKESK